MKLFGYISGANSDGASIPMTAPVLNSNKVKIIRTQYFILISTAQGKLMCFYLSEEFQANPPQPISSSIALVKMDERTVMAKRIGG